VVADATRANLTSAGLWNQDDRLCLQKTAQETKAGRRREIVSGTGDCGWPAAPMRVMAFVGDQLGDFPDSAEQIPQTGDDSVFGRTCFLLPNSMYGAWTSRVTRIR
jgi:predicted secreted acid phosphatase